MAIGNKGFADLIAGAGPEDLTPAEPRRLPRSGILGERQNRIAELVGGGAVTRMHELVDPARCRIWDGHNRDYAALSTERCADLIESFKAQGRQEVPAIVRRVTGDPRHEFEVICGARRHWTVGWLRAHDHPEFRYLVEPRELTDEEAFRLADLENRQRQDLSDYERATDYTRAISRYYGGSQQRMVDRLEVSKSWLSRYLELARLPKPVLASFGTPHAVGISHAATLAPLLRAPHTHTPLLEEARQIVQLQEARAEAGEAFLPPAQVVRRLVAATRRSGRRIEPVTLRDEQEKVLGTACWIGKRPRKGEGKRSVALQLTPAGLAGRDAALRTVEGLLRQLGALKP